MSDNIIKILGASGGKSNDNELVCIEVSPNIFIDAGNIINGATNIDKIEHIFITHSHLDHILDIALLIDATFATRKISLKVYGSIGTLKSIKEHILNWEIWPDFTQINLTGTQIPSVELINIDIDQTIQIDQYKIKAIKNNHTKNSNGYVVTKDNKSILFSSDTYKCDEIWTEINNNLSISSIVIDVSFPSNMEKLASQSKHLTPKLLAQELMKLERDDIIVYAHHIKPNYLSIIENEFKELNVLKNNGKILNSKDRIYY